MAKSPYLEDDRLSYIIAAIQVMGTKEWASGKIDRWVRELEGSEQLGTEKEKQPPIKDADLKKWETIFVQHPEFFKLYSLDDGLRVALRWRFAQTINYDPKTSKIVSANEIQKMRDSDRYAKLTRRPLTAGEIEVLIKTAIELHDRVIAAQQERRWRWPIITTAATAILSLLGVALGAYLKSN